MTSRHISLEFDDEDWTASLYDLAVFVRQAAQNGAENVHLDANTDIGYGHLHAYTRKQFEEELR